MDHQPAVPHQLSGLSGGVNEIWKGVTSSTTWRPGERGLAPGSGGQEAAGVSAAVGGVSVGTRPPTLGWLSVVRLMATIAMATTAAAASAMRVRLFTG